MCARWPCSRRGDPRRVGLTTALARIRQELVPQERDDPTISFDEWARLITQFTFQGVNYTIPTQTQEKLDATFPIMARAAYKANGVVFACVANRMDLFSEARFLFRRIRNSKPSGLFANPELRILERSEEHTSE